MTASILTQSIVKHLLNYDPTTGLLTRKVRTSNAINIGDVAGTKSKKDGYIRIQVQGFPRLAHRLAYLYMEGSVPDLVEHDNQNPSDNRWENLKAGTKISNARNTKKHSHNTSGVTGVSFRNDTGRWTVHITIKGKKINLGCYDSIKEATTVRKKANIKYGFHINHGK